MHRNNNDSKNNSSLGNASSSPSNNIGCKSDNFFRYMLVAISYMAYNEAVWT